MEFRRGSGQDQSTGPSPGSVAGLGITWAASVLLFLGAGWWLDGKLGTVPLFTILGAGLGAGSGLWYIVKEVRGAASGGREPE